MTMLIASALFFLLLHLLVAGTRGRDAIVKAIGERPYLGAFSVASAIGIVWLVISYNRASAEGRHSYANGVQLQSEGASQRAGTHPGCQGP